MISSTTEADGIDPAAVLLDALRHQLNDVWLAVEALPDLSTLPSTQDHDGDDGAASHGAALTLLDDGLDALADCVEHESLRLAALGRDGLPETLHALTEEAETIAGEEAQVTALADEVRAAIAALLERVQHDDASLRQHQEESTTALQTFAAELHEEHDDAAGDAFHRLGESLGDRCMAPVDAGFRLVEHETASAFDGFHTEVERAGSGWARAAGHLLGDSAQHITDTLTREVHDAIEELIREGIQAIIEELIEQVVTVSAGAATTTALAPTLPLLSSAKHALRIVNRVLEALGR